MTTPTLLGGMLLLLLLLSLLLSLSFVFTFTCFRIHTSAVVGLEVLKRVMLVACRAIRSTAIPCAAIRC